MNAYEYSKDFSLNMFSYCENSWWFFLEKFIGNDFPKKVDIDLYKKVYENWIFRKLPHFGERRIDCNDREYLCEVIRLN